jgi:predicted amino acid-binding ACT domain protein
MLSNPIFSLQLTPEGQRTLLTFSGFHNDFGIIYRISAVLYFHDLSIYRIHAETIADETVSDTFLIDAPFENVSILQKDLESDLQRLFTKEIAVLSYIASIDAQTEKNDVHIKIRARRDNGESLNDSIRDRLQETLFKVI